MSKMADFYVKVSSKEELLVKVNAILAGKDITEADDGQLEQIGALAKEEGFEITLAEAKEYLAKGEFDLADGALGDVAGGLRDGKETHNTCKGEGAGISIK